MDKRKDWGATRAYQLWEGAGQPVGQHHEHWTQASVEWETQKNLMAGKNASPANWDEDEL